MGAPLVFEAIASDPEDGALSHEWDFGDGATSHDARAEHAYEAPGAYEVTLRVVDKAGNAATASAELLVDGAWDASGAFEPLGADVAELDIVAARDAKTLTLTLSFDAGSGLHDLEIIVLDAAGDEVDRSAGEPQPGAQGDATRTLSIEAFDAPGAWTVQVVRERGLSVAWSLDVIETL
jgi:hypothetical protein